MAISMTVAATCLAAAVYFESRGEPLDGQIAVAEVVMNRVESEKYPDDVCSVVTQNKYPGILNRCQFSFYCNGQLEVVDDDNAWIVAKEIATGVLDGSLSLGVPATHYHTTEVLPFWAKHYTEIGLIGNHRFYIAGDLE